MRSFGRSSSRHPWGSAFACWCTGVAAFEAGLAAGAPWGAAAWGGGHPGVLPRKLRLASGAAVAVLAGLAAVAGGRLVRGRGRPRVLLGAAAYASLGIVANAASPSGVERAIWTPMSALGAALAVQSWREARRAAGGLH